LDNGPEGGGVLEDANEAVIELEPIVYPQLRDGRVHGTCVLRGRVFRIVAC
jgi:hypothetical protein